LNPSAPIAVVLGWQDAVNEGDTEGLLALSDPAIEIVGPRGTARGHAILREWLGRAGARFETRRAFARGEAVVIEQRGVWRSAETGEVTGEAIVASAFLVRAGKVSRVARHDTPEAALRDVGLDEDDEIASV
jgi:hypothetical protein